MAASPPRTGALAITLSFAPDLGQDEDVIETLQQLPYITPTNIETMEEISTT